MTKSWNIQSWVFILFYILYIFLQLKYIIILLIIFVNILPIKKGF